MRIVFDFIPYQSYKPSTIIGWHTTCSNGTSERKDIDRQQPSTPLQLRNYTSSDGDLPVQRFCPANNCCSLFIVPSCLKRPLTHKSALCLVVVLASSMSRLRCCDDAAEIKSLHAPARTRIVPSRPEASSSSLSGGTCAPDSKMRTLYAGDDAADANQQSMTLSPISVVTRRPPVLRRFESCCFEPVQSRQRSEVSLLLPFHQDQVHCHAAEDGLAGLKFLRDDFNLDDEEGESPKSRLRSNQRVE